MGPRRVRFRSKGRAEKISVRTLMPTGRITAIPRMMIALNAKADSSAGSPHALLLLVTIAFGCLCFLNFGIAGDGASYVSWIRSVVIDHDLDFTIESREISARGWREDVHGMMRFRLMTPLAWLPA